MSNADGKDTKRVGRWKDKEYSKQIMEYVNQSLRSDEKTVYDVLFKELAEKFNIVEVNEIMLLDLAVNDYIRVKRLHHKLKDTTDIIEIKTRTGQTVPKAHEAGYLLNSVETQFRQNMKELMLTPKSRIQKTIGMEPKTFTDAIIKVVDADYSGVEEDANRKQSGTDNAKEEKTDS